MPYRENHLAVFRWAHFLTLLPNQKIPKLSAGWSQTIYVVWRHLRTEKEVALAERNYQKMLALRGTVPTTKKVGKVEPRPFMSAALEKSRAKMVELWKEAIF